MTPSMSPLFKNFVPQIICLHTMVCCTEAVKSILRAVKSLCLNQTLTVYFMGLAINSSLLLFKPLQEIPDVPEKR